jgi:multidrug efflux system membrane fusion protein
MKKFTILPTLLITLFLVLMSGCDKPQNASVVAPPAQPAPPPSKAKIAQPLNQKITEWDEFTGRIEAVNTVEVRARVSGYLEKVNFAAGATVKKGDLLFVIDSKPFKAQLSYAVAELAQAKSKQELAKNELTRAENLLKAKAISIEEYDARNKGLRGAAAAVDSATAQVASVQLNLEFTEVRAPINGRIGRELITAGNLVNGSGGDATKLATIVSTNPVYVTVDVDERAILNYRREAQKQGRNLEGTKVELALSDEQGFPHSGHVDYVAPTENPVTGTVSLRGVFTNADELLSPGFFARMRLRGGAPYDGLLLPDRAIGSDQANRIIWVMNSDKKVTRRKIIAGKKIGDLRVISEGLKADDWVVIEGLQKLRPDSVIEPEKITLTTPEKD